jgi:hypothetical protein
VRYIQNDVIRFFNKGQIQKVFILILTLIDKTNNVILNVLHTNIGIRTIFRYKERNQGVQNIIIIIIINNWNSKNHLKSAKFITQSKVTAKSASRTSIKSIKPIKICEEKSKSCDLRAIIK